MAEVFHEEDRNAIVEANHAVTEAELKVLELKVAFDLGKAELEGQQLKLNRLVLTGMKRLGVVTPKDMLVCFACGSVYKSEAGKCPACPSVTK